VQIRPQFVLVIVVTNRQTNRYTHTQTNAEKKTYSLAFAGIIIQFLTQQFRLRLITGRHSAYSWC